MTLAITHLKTSLKADLTDASEVRPSDWNAAHVLTGLASVAQGGTGLGSFSIGDLLYASGASALSALADVAAGSVLVSGGVGLAPAWSASPTLTKVLLGDGTASLPSITFANQTNAGLYLANAASGVVGIAAGGAALLNIYNDVVHGVQLPAAVPLSWGTLGGTPDVYVFRDAANTLGLRNGTAAQALNLYNTYTSASIFEALQVTWASNVATIQTTKGGSGGSARGITIVPIGGFFQFGASATGNPQWAIGTTGHILANTDNSYDIGAAAANRPRNGYLSGTLDLAGVATLASATATPAGGSTAARLIFGTTAGFGVYYGSGAPTVSAAQGSIYLRSDGSSTSTRLYVNTNGSTTWTPVTTAA